MKGEVIQGDCLDVLRGMPAATFDAVVTDPPAGIAFMGREWDGDRGGRAAWVGWLAEVLAECRRVAKPGARLLCWSIPRTSHWTGTAVEDAGWVIEDVVAHLFGTGFPKGKSKLKPAREDWWLARNPSKGVPPLNVDACRVPTEENPSGNRRQYANASETGTLDGDRWVDRRRPETFQAERPGEAAGRWPANVTHDGSPEVLEAFAEFGERKGSPESWRDNGGQKNRVAMNCADDGSLATPRDCVGYGGSGTAARFFYCPKASKADRGEGNDHPTVKSTALMRYLCRLITPAGGVVLDPFAGSGSTGKAAALEGFGFVGIEREPEYVEIARRRISEALAAPPEAAA